MRSKAELIAEIAKQQQIQMTHKPTSEEWIAASAKIHELAEQLTGKPCKDALGK